MTTEPTHVERGRGTHPDARVKGPHLSGGTRNGNRTLNVADISATATRPGRTK